MDSGLPVTFSQSKASQSTAKSPGKAMIQGKAKKSMGAFDHLLLIQGYD
jgi:hypothetical protein